MAALRVSLQAARAKALPALSKSLALALKASAESTSDLQQLMLAFEDFYSPAGLQNISFLAFTDSEVTLYCQQRLPLALTSILDRLEAIFPAEYPGASLHFWELAGAVWSLAATLLWVLSQANGGGSTQIVEQIIPAGRWNVKGKTCLHVGLCLSHLVFNACISVKHVADLD